jgi:hypothetical protein
VHFDECLDRKKVLKIVPYLPALYAELDKLAPRLKGKWPKNVRCMDSKGIVEGRAKGAGHGYTYVNGPEIWLNRHMTWQGYWLVLAHENLHHAFPDATESEINCLHVPRLYERVFGKKLTPAEGRRHGLGAPESGMGDRSYCR